MIVCRLELWPCGNKDTAVSLGTIVITNDGSGSVMRGHYEARCWGKKGRPLKRYGEVRNFPRRSLTAFHLLKRVLTTLGY